MLASELLGWRTVCAVELDPYARNVLLARQDDGCLEPFPIWDDVTTFDGRPWAGCVDVISGGFPCSDIAVCKQDAEGIEGEASGLWVEFARIVREVRPRYVFVENSPALTTRGLDVVLGALAAMGFDAEWGVLGANAAILRGSHVRERIWILADAERERLEGHKRAPGEAQVSESRDGSTSSSSVDSLQRVRELLVQDSRDARARLPVSSRRGVGREPLFTFWEDARSGVPRVSDGVADRVDRLRCIGNGQVPAVAALAWTTLKARLDARA